MTKKATKPAFIISSFKDSGTGQNFTKDDVVPIELGSFANYAAADLVRKPTAEELKAAGLVDPKATDTGAPKPPVA